MQQRKPVRIECRECGFRKLIGPADDRLPADTVIEHGRNSGHKLSVEPVET